MKQKEWFEHAKKNIEKMKGFNLMSPIGFYENPGNYLDTIEDYVKLFYKINETPQDVIELFNLISKSFEDFKMNLALLSCILLDQIEKIEENNQK